MNNPDGQDASVLPKIEGRLTASEDSKIVNNVNTSTTIHGNNNRTDVAVYVSNLGRRLRAMPAWVQFAFIVLIAIFVFLVFWRSEGSSAKQSRFVSEIEASVRESGTDFQSATNVMLNVIPSNIIPENGPEQWAAISRLWMRSGQTVNDVFSNAAKCLSSRECAVGSTAQEVCKRAALLTQANLEAYSDLEQVSGISINTSGAPSEFGLPDGVGEVMLPDLSNLFSVAKACTERLGK